MSGPGSRQGKYAGLVFLFIVFACYLRTAAPSVTGGDSGELIAASWELGAAHPPGYSLYVLLGRLFSFLPLGGVAFRYNLFSALAAAAAIWILGSMLVDHGVSPLLSWPLVLYFSVCPLVWGTATAAEVYAPFLAVLLLSLHAGLRPGLRHCCLGMFLAALSMGLHYMGLAALAALAVYHFSLRGWRWRNVLAVVLAASLGLSLLVMFPLFTVREPLVNWGDPGTCGRLWALISRGEFRQVERSTWTWPGVMDNATMVGSMLGRSLLWIGLVPAVAGLAIWAKRHGRLSRAWSVAFAVAVTGIIMYSPPVMEAELKRHVMEVFCVVPLLLLAYPLGQGLKVLSRFGKTKAAAVILAVLLLAAAGIRGPHEFSRQNRRNDTLAVDFARNLLLPMPAGSLLLSTGDSVTFPIWYLLTAGRLRNRALTCISIPSLTYRWYPPQLARRYPELKALAGRRFSNQPPDTWFTGLLFKQGRAAGQVFVSGEKTTPPEPVVSYRWGLGKRLDYAGPPVRGQTARETLAVTAGLWERYQLRAVYHPPLASYVDRGLLITYRSFLYNLGNELIGEGQLAAAESFLTIALDIFPRYSSAWFNLGYLYSRTGRPEPALQAYETAAQDSVFFARAKASRGAILFEKNDLAGAESEYRQSLRSDPAGLEALIGLGAVAYSRRQWPEARVWWQEALRLDPANQLVLENLAILENMMDKKGH